MPSQPPSQRRYTPLALPQVQIEDLFWAPRQRSLIERGLPHQLDQLQRSGAVTALEQRPGPLAIPILDWGGTPQMFWDSDIAKWIEGASYALALQPDPALEEKVDALVAALAAAQQEDGYLNTYFTAHAPHQRFTNERDWHELYCAGHLTEAAVARFQVTGKRDLLEVMERYLELLRSVYGPGPGQKHGYPGHEEIELALLRLYRVTGRPEHLAFAQYFIDERGKSPNFFDEEARARGEDPAAYHQGTHQYAQAHRPVREQDQVVGHAVRAMYLYTAMADLAAQTGDQSLWAACTRLWQDLTGKRLYVTGGLGPSAHNEGFSTDYDLPNATAYAETCASVGLVFWASKMLEASGDGRYADVLEQALYNNVLAGVGLSGDRYFYDNVLESRGDHHRWEWHACPCCPPNALRLILSLGSYAYGAGESELAVHLYIQGRARAEIAGRPVELAVETRYPWEGKVAIRLGLESPLPFTLSLRIPAWSRDTRLWVGGEPVQLADCLRDGYARLERRWSPGDLVELQLDLAVRALHAHPEVRDDLGRIALQRGPLVYCLEGTDHAVPLHRIALSQKQVAALAARFKPELLGGLMVLRGEASALDTSDWDTLYRDLPARLQPQPLTAVPYAFWDHRASGAMCVWIPRSG
jgi:DUF1680 family protein